LGLSEGLGRPSKKALKGVLPFMPRDRGHDRGLTGVSDWILVSKTVSAPDWGQASRVNMERNSF
jgi:hypothetical protein